MQLELTHLALEKVEASTLIVFATQTKSKKDESLVHVKAQSTDLKKRLAGMIDDKVITGKAGETHLLRAFQFGSFQNIIICGLGNESEMNGENLRSAGGSIEGILSSGSIKSALVDIGSLSGKKSEDFLKGLTEGLLLAAYRFEELKSKKDDDKNKTETKVLIHIGKANKTLQNAFEDSVTLTECVNFSRRLGDMPGNHMTPSILANEVVKAAKGTKLKVTVWDKARIKKEKMGGLLGVSNGSSEDPRFIIMEYKGTAASKKPVAFVGKGLTFDSGGISIKPSASMEEMKYDMCGGANVIGTMLAIAKLGLKINAIGLIPSTENMPSGTATKPGDIHTARNGKTFEVNNTDAEGRLILADALCYASEQKPQAIFDAATLTGAIVVALGNTHTGYFTRDQKLKSKIESAAGNSGEWVWNMPLCDFHVKDIKGTFADLSNISSSKGAGSATAAAFLEQFVEKEIPWAHFDIAGTAWAVGGRLNYCPKKGASGVMVRTFVELAKSYE